LGAEGAVVRTAPSAVYFFNVAPAGSEASVMIRLGEAPGFSSRIQRFEAALSLQRFVHS